MYRKRGGGGGAVHLVPLDASEAKQCGNITHTCQPLKYALLLNDVTLNFNHWLSVLSTMANGIYFSYVKLTFLFRLRR